MGWLPSVAPACSRPHGHHRVTIGHVVSYPAFYRSRELLPICDEITEVARSMPFSFHMIEGQVLFTKPPLP